MPPLNDDVREILGRPCFACGQLAAILRLGGAKIETRAEDEQAAVIHWMLSLYESHPDTWRNEGEARLRAMIACAKADKAASGRT